MSFAGAVAFVLEREGGFADHKADKGGATKYGITHGTLARARGVPSATVQDVKALRISEAVDIYERHYWLAAKCDQMPGRIALCHFDAAVNHGVGQAAKFLQRALGVPADGIIGPVTLAALATAQEPPVVTRYLETRAAFFRALVAKNPSQQVFLLGWLARCRHVARECNVPVGASYA